MDHMIELCEKFCPEELRIAQEKPMSAGVRSRLDDADDSTEEEEEEEEE